MSSSIRAVVITFLLATAGSLMADINLPAPVTLPPQAEPINARVFRGQRVTIELRGHYGGGAAVHFRVVRPPAHGELSDLHAVGQTRAQITYSCSGGRESEADGFSYTLQAGNQASSPAEVRIQIEEAPARLLVPEQLDFGEIEAGKMATRELPIQNAGGGLLEGRLTISSPWIIAPAEYRVEAGETETVKVAFQPNESKAFVGQVTLTDGRGNAATVSLSGTATATAISVAAPVSSTAEVTEATPAADVKSESPTETRASPSVAPTITAAPLIPPPDSTIAPVQEVNPAVSTTSSAWIKPRRLSPSLWELQWQAENDKPGATYRIEERLLTLDAKGALETDWREVVPVKIELQPDRVIAQVHDLDPRQLHMLRVTALDPERTVLWDSPLVALAAERKPASGHSWWLLGLFCALPAFLFLRWRANRVSA